MRPLRTLAAACVCLAAAAVPAGAQTGKATPGCAGYSVQDPAGDNAQPSGANQDVRGLFFLTNAQGRTTANIEVAEFFEEVPAPFTAATWYAVWGLSDGSFQFVSASLERLTPGLFYSYGSYDPTIGYSTQGDSAGRAWPGPDGVIQIAIPTDKAPPGETLIGPYASATSDLSVPGVGGLVFNRDRAPSSGGGKDYLAQPCPAA